jgi:hypothetical protein
VLSFLPLTASVRLDRAVSQKRYHRAVEDAFALSSKSILISHPNLKKHQRSVALACTEADGKQGSNLRGRR